MISDTQQQMLTLLADTLHNKEPEKLPAEKWGDIFKELRDQTVYSLPSEYAHYFGLSAAEEMNYLKAVVNNRKRFHLLMKEQQNILSLLEENEIPVVVLKGAASAVYYPHPEDRCMGDIDILVEPGNFNKAYEALISAGYESEQTPQNFDRHILFFPKNKVVVELHNFFSSSDNEAQNALLDQMLLCKISSGEKHSVSGYEINMLPVTENGLVLLDHINHHISRGIGLRQIIDWMYYAEAVLDDEFWESTFAEKADMIGEKRLAMVVTAMCRKYLGFNKDIHWCSYEPICDELMEYILYHGNFNRKIEKNKSDTVSVLKKFKNPIHGLADAQKYGLTTWKAVKKYKFLKPFAWIYQMIRWARLGIKRGVSLEMLSKASSDAKAEIEFLEKLGVTRL